MYKDSKLESLYWGLAEGPSLLTLLVAVLPIVEIVDLASTLHVGDRYPPLLAAPGALLPLG